MRDRVDYIPLEEVESDEEIASPLFFEHGERQLVVADGGSIGT
jgi:hypothetical protein